MQGRSICGHVHARTYLLGVLCEPDRFCQIFLAIRVHALPSNARVRPPTAHRTPSATDTQPFAPSTPKFVWVLVAVSGAGWVFYFFVAVTSFSSHLSSCKLYSPTCEDHYDLLGYCPSYHGKSNVPVGERICDAGTTFARRQIARTASRENEWPGVYVSLLGLRRVLCWSSRASVLCDALPGRDVHLALQTMSGRLPLLGSTHQVFS